MIKQCMNVIAKNLTEPKGLSTSEQTDCSTSILYNSIHCKKGMNHWYMQIMGESLKHYAE